MQFLASGSWKLCGVLAGAGFAGHKMDWSLIRNSVLALYFLCLIPTNTFSPSIHHTVTKDRHRRQICWRQEIAWCSNPVFLLLWDEMCSGDQIQKKGRNYYTLFFVLLFVSVFVIPSPPGGVNNYCGKSLLLFSHKLFSNESSETCMIMQDRFCCHILYSLSFRYKITLCSPFKVFAFTFY